MNYSYAGIEFVLPHTHDVSTRAVFSGDGMDYLYSVISVDISATVNPAAMAYTLADGSPTATPDTLPATTLAAIRHTLTQPRQQLLITDFDGQTLLQCPGEGFDVDAVDGPKPEVLSIVEVNGARTFAIRWRVTCKVIDCPEGTTAPLIISNRWQDSHHINEHQLNTRIITGEAVFRQDFLEAIDAQPDDYRHYLLPVVEPGYQRMVVDVTENSNRTRLAYRLIDNERVVHLGETDPRQGGSGILNIDGKQSITSTGTNEGPTCGITMNQIWLIAHGGAISSQWIMCQYLFRLASTMASFGNFAVSYIRHASISRSLGQGEKSIELTLALQQTQSDQATIGNLRIDSLRIDVSQIYEALASQSGGINPGLLNDSGSRGTSITRMVVAGLTQSCQLFQIADSDGGEITGTVPPRGPEPPVVSIRTDDILPSFPTTYATGFPASQYTQYKSELQYKNDTGCISCPIAGPVSSGSGSGSGIAQSVAVFRLRQPTSEMIVTGIAERVQGRPTLPAPISTDDNLVLLEWNPVATSPTVLNDGITPVFRVGYYYRYALLTPLDPTSPSFNMGILPWTNIPFSSSVMTPDDFSQGIISDPNGSTGPP
jgi:hypothetical protein